MIERHIRFGKLSVFVSCWLFRGDRVQLKCEVTWRLK